MSLLGNLPFLKTSVNCFMAQDDSPGANVISKCMLWVRGLVPLSVLRNLLSIINSLLVGEGNGTPLQYFCLENPWMEEPGRLQSMGLLRVGHD